MKEHIVCVCVFLCEKKKDEKKREIFGVTLRKLFFYIRAFSNIFCIWFCSVLIVFRLILVVINSLLNPFCQKKYFSSNFLITYALRKWNRFAVLTLLATMQMKCKQQCAHKHTNKPNGRETILFFKYIEHQAYEAF